MKCWVGIDLGSTTTKAVVLDEEQRVVGRGITNSRNDYDVACAVARAEAFTSVRFTLCERALEGTSLEPAARRGRVRLGHLEDHVGAREAVFEREHAGEHARRHHRRGEARAFLVGPVDDHHRCRRLIAHVHHGTQRLESAKHPQHAVELAAGRLGVEMAAERDRSQVRPPARTPACSGSWRTSATVSATAVGDQPPRAA